MDLAGRRSRCLDSFDQQLCRGLRCYIDQMTDTDVPFGPDRIADLPPSGRTSSSRTLDPAPGSLALVPVPLSETMQCHLLDVLLNSTRTTLSFRPLNACRAALVTNSAITRPRRSQVSAGKTPAFADTSQRTPAGFNTASDKARHKLSTYIGTAIGPARAPTISNLCKRPKATILASHRANESRTLALWMIQTHSRGRPRAVLKYPPCGDASRAAAANRRFRNVLNFPVAFSNVRSWPSKNPLAG